MLERKFIDGRTDLIFDLLEDGRAPTATIDGTTLLAWCAYYGDVSAVRLLMTRGADLHALGEDLGLNGACFHGHWRLAQFLLERGAPVNARHPDTQETALHAALCRPDDPAAEPLVAVLLNHGAAPNAVTTNGAETGAFMRDARTRGETPLHRAAAFAAKPVIERLIEAGADKTRRDAHGDTPLSWASWHGRETEVLRALAFDPHRIHPDRKPMTEALRGAPHLGDDEAKADEEEAGGR